MPKFDLPSMLSVKVRRFLAQFLNEPGYSKCAHCGGTWNWLAGKDIPHHSDGAMFPVCTGCFQKLTVAEIIAYAENLVTETWDQTWETYKDKVESSVKFLKGDGATTPPFESSFWPE